MTHDMDHDLRALDPRAGNGLSDRRLQELLRSRATPPPEPPAARERRGAHRTGRRTRDTGGSDQAGSSEG
ncbi:hypothetical protein [Ornithinimicrobium cavernae]|uniref:hypothetical protein n=1 Tax=Ornithinimicrobium cavernae TaxID=2666047 RepID=UPI000D690533|nr:hypothetical protein [Ornithinimicrobium cavernae]